MQFIVDKTWEPLKTRGLKFFHLNVNSFLSKIDELRDITNYRRPAILGITESKLDSSITNAEVNVNGDSIYLGMIETEMVEVLQVILEMICVLISKHFFKFYCFFRNSHNKSQTYCNRDILQPSK